MHNSGFPRIRGIFALFLLSACGDPFLDLNDVPPRTTPSLTPEMARQEIAELAQEYTVLVKDEKEILA